MFKADPVLVALAREEALADAVEALVFAALAMIAAYSAIAFSSSFWSSI